MDDVRIGHKLTIESRHYSQVLPVATVPRSREGRWTTQDSSVRSPRLDLVAGGLTQGRRKGHRRGARTLRAIETEDRRFVRHEFGLQVRALRLSISQLKAQLPLTAANELRAAIPAAARGRVPATGTRARLAVHGVRAGVAPRVPTGGSKVPRRNASRDHAPTYRRWRGWRRRRRRQWSHIGRVWRARGWRRRRRR